MTTVAEMIEILDGVDFGTYDYIWEVYCEMDPRYNEIEQARIDNEPTHPYKQSKYEMLGTTPYIAAYIAEDGTRFEVHRYILPGEVLLEGAPNRTAFDSDNICLTDECVRLHKQYMEVYNKWDKEYPHYSVSDMIAYDNGDYARMMCDEYLENNS